MKYILIENAIVRDHSIIRNLYQKFLNSTLRADSLQWYNQMAYDIAVHSIAEEIVLYPLIRSHFPDGKKIIESNLDGHRFIKGSLLEIESISASDKALDMKIKSMMEYVSKHMDKEEKDELPKLPSLVSEAKRLSAGSAYEMRRWIAPTRPHTIAPDKYPMLESLSALILKPLDAFRDLFRQFPSQSEMDKIRSEIGEENIKH